MSLDIASHYEHLCHGDECEERVSHKGWLCPKHYAEREGETRHVAYVEWVRGLGYPVEGVSQEGLFNAGWIARTDSLSYYEEMSG